MAGFHGLPLSLIQLILALTGSLLLLPVSSIQFNLEDRADQLPSMRMPEHPQDMQNCPGAGGFGGITDCEFSSGCGQHLNLHQNNVRKLAESTRDSMRIALKHRDHNHFRTSVNRFELLRLALLRDTSRGRSIHHRRTQRKPYYLSSIEHNNQAQEASQAMSRVFGPPDIAAPPFQDSPLSPDSVYQFEGTVESGLAFGSGEYFMDVYIGTPRRHFSLIIDTGSDLNWVQCNPCQDCYTQEGAKFDRNASFSYNPILCSDSRCQLVYSPHNEACNSEKVRTCTYFYWYGDSSNTTGDLATETFTLNVSDGGLFQADNVIFGCGHNNEGLFHGAGGLLGLGRGPLSFASQLLRLYGRKFSYCLVGRDNNSSVSSTLIFGEDKVLSSHPDLQYTSFTVNTSMETFYYVDVEKVSVGGQFLSIPSTVWQMDSQGSGGTIVDSGTTVTYFVKPAYEAIKAAFQGQIRYTQVESDILDLCYNVEGISDVKFPSFEMVFKDGAVWKLPAENYFIDLYADRKVLCLAVMGSSSATRLSILGNFLQQNMHMLYDLHNSRLGFAPMTCSHVKA